MATDEDIEQFICDSFTSIWDLELLATVIAMPQEGLTAVELVERMRASEPVNEDVERSAMRANNFYQRFPGRARRLMISRQAPGLNAFADAFRLRKD